MYKEKKEKSKGPHSLFDQGEYKKKRISFYAIDKKHLSMLIDKMIKGKLKNGQGYSRCTHPYPLI